VALAQAGSIAHVGWDLDDQMHRNLAWWLDGLALRQIIEDAVSTLLSEDAP